MFIYKRFLFFIFMVTSLLCGVSAFAEGLNLRTDFYASYTHLMPYQGTQGDVSVTLYADYDDYRFVPFIRGLFTNYHYKLPSATNYLDDNRSSGGLGFDYRIFDSLRFRFIWESIHNDLADTTYSQDSYGFIYNQYIELTGFELNNYAESFYIPRVTKDSMDTFARVQALKSFYFERTPLFSHALYPFVQFKAKVNDDATFGLSGQNASVGAGYKFYSTNESLSNSFSATVEGHSVFYQSKDFNGDWFQVLGALQWVIK